MQQLNQDIHHNDLDQLLRDNDKDNHNQERLIGFIKEYQIKVIEKLNQTQTKFLLWILNFEIYLSTLLLAYLYYEETSCGTFEVFPHFTLFFLVITCLEIFMRITVSCQLRREAEQFYSKEQKLLYHGVGFDESSSKCMLELNPIWSLLQLETIYALSLCQKLGDYNTKMIDLDERINENQGQVITHTSIQTFYSYVRFRQVYLNMKISLFIIILTNVCGADSDLSFVIIMYIALLVGINIWINFHLAVVYLFCKQAYLSFKDNLYLMGEIALKCIHSLSFFYVFIHAEDILPYFSVFFMSSCTLVGVCITISINSLFDSSHYNIFELIFFGYSTNYYIGLKHKEYFVNRVGYEYKKDILKQVAIFCIQIATILHYYEINKSLSQSHLFVILGIVLALAFFRIGVILIKVNYYLKPKQILVRLQNVEGTTQFIDEDYNKSLVSRSSASNYQQTKKQELQIELQISPKINQEIHHSTDSENEEEKCNNPSKFDLKKKEINCQQDLTPIRIDFNFMKHLQQLKETKVKQIFKSKMENNQFKITFYTNSKTREFNQNVEMQCILQELVKYKKSELQFLISNEIKIWNQYGHINVLIHKYDTNLLLFIEKNITPYSRSIQIDSNYKKNSDTYIQLMLLYNIINKELDVNTKISLKPMDLVQNLPLPQQRKQDYLQVVNRICSAKMICILKILAYRKSVSPQLFQNPCQVLYDLYQDESI